MFESIKMMGVECGLYCIVYYCIDACAYRNDVAGCKTTSGFENDILSYRFTHMMMSKPMGARRVRGSITPWIRDVPRINVLRGIDFGVPLIFAYFDACLGFITETNSSWVG